MSLALHTTKPRVPVIVGPTCSGKTAVSLALATRVNGEIISADSRQVYKHLDIGTAKPSPADRRRIKHHFVDELDPSDDFNAGMFGEQARALIMKILGRGKLPIIVGGSGLYVRSLIDGLFEGPGADRALRQLLERKLEEHGVTELLNELRRVDPESASTIDPTKPRRIIRALEVFHLTGRPVSVLHHEKKIDISFEPLLFGLKWPRAVLYRRIEERCDEMIASGLLREVEQLEKLGYNDSMNALNTVGYAEAFSYRRGEISYEDFARLFKQNSRRYAKRQMTWFNSDGRIRWIAMSEQQNIVDVAREIERNIPD